MASPPEPAGDHSKAGNAGLNLSIVRASLEMNRRRSLMCMLSPPTQVFSLVLLN